MNSNKTEEIFYRIKEKNLIPAGYGLFAQKREAVVNLDRIPLLLSEREKEETLKQMKKLEDSDGFLFWYESDEGREWKEENKDSLCGCVRDYLRKYFGIAEEEWNEKI